ncbi:T-cell-specific surface glycoprotein CD28 [Elgaria multicarinata webbii]|uniref:T-cell-specific surface glycoprotein CD28 n=1 Tax=Elgaria multicarinata webbii TaxID=159646 RepID=UPI002FCD5195
MIFWILLAALSIIQSTCIAEETISLQQNPSPIVTAQNATIFCNYKSKRDDLNAMKGLLLKGILKSEVCSLFWNKTFSSNKTNSDFTCEVNVQEEKSIIFDLRDLAFNQTDNYFCKIEVIDPAPYESTISPYGTLIHVKETQCHQEELEYRGFAAAIGVLIIYSVLITAAFYYCWAKTKKKKTVRNDYLNMTPWQTNGQKKRHHQPGVPARNFTAYRTWEP